MKRKYQFTPLKNEIIYIESGHSDFIDCFIKQNLEVVISKFKEKNLDFVYIPNIIDYYNNQDCIELIQYIKPDISESHIDNIKNLLTSEDILKKLHYLIYGTSDRIQWVNAGLLHYNRGRFYYNELSGNNNLEIWHEIDKYLNPTKGILSINSLKVACSIVKFESNDADNNFPTEARQLIKEIQERVERLKQIGIREFILKELFSIDEVKLSRLLITKDYRILLIDYNNLEIKMSPLPKAIYFLFLRHPEGIMFKELPDYKYELRDIYLKISNREDIDAINNSILEVVNPTKNSINEKCSRIREAFIKHFDESIAENYFITGNRATPKMITLDRALIFEE